MERWELALHIAEDCYQKLEEKVSTIKEMEIRSMGALELLTERLLCAWILSSGASILMSVGLCLHSHTLVSGTLQHSPTTVHAKFPWLVCAKSQTSRTTSKRSFCVEHIYFFLNSS